MNSLKTGILVLGALLFIFYPSHSHSQIVDGNVIMDKSMNENLCALTFDDGPSQNTATLLDMLAHYNIPATFFLLGQQVRHHPDLLERMLAEGHEVGNHSWSHPNLRKLSTDAQYSQILETDKLLRSHGAVPLFIRPPYGSFDERTVNIANELGLSILLWSLDSKDWKRLPDDYGKLVSTRGTVYEDGQLHGIFLFHDTHKTTVDDLPRIISNLQTGGCDRFVTVSEYLRELADPEAGLLMTRHTPKRPRDNRFLKYMAGSGSLKLARCSKPLFQIDKREQLPLDDAQAAFSQTQGGI